MEAILGAELLTKEGMKPTAEVLAGKKLVGLYFSAHWCPPCRRFTPHLSTLYEDYINGGDDGDMVIIFVSSDRDAASCADYYGGMSFACLPFANRAAKEALSKKYGVRGIPMLVVCRPDGGVVVANARGEAQSSQDLGKLVEAWSARS